MITALGIAFYNRPDLLKRCIESVDHPVGTLIVVNNGSNKELSALVGEMRNDRIARRVVAEPNRNLGVAGAWNLIQEQVFHINGLDSVLICGNDIQWMPGDLEIFARTVEEFPQADFVFGNHSYSNFLVKRSGFKRIGYFDENIEMAYLEDSDHWQRIIRTPAKAIHAAGLRALHEGSATIKSDAAYQAVVGAQHEKNWSYYSRKWGCPLWSSGKESFATPWNEPDAAINEWQLTGDRLNRPHFRRTNPLEMLES